jgi:hypothetical protein
VNVIEDKNGKHIETKINVTSIIEVMSSNGELKIQNSQQQLLEFFDLQAEIIKYKTHFNLS